MTGATAVIPAHEGTSLGTHEPNTALLNDALKPHVPYSRRQQALVILVYTGLMALLVLSFFATLWLVTLPWVASAGPMGELVFRRPGASAIIGVPLAFSGVFSWLASGYARARLDRLGDAILMFVSLAYILVFGAVAHSVSRASANIDSQLGDNGSALVYVAVWVLLCGYAVKALYDEARDRLARALMTFLPRWGL